MGYGPTGTSGLSTCCSPVQTALCLLAALTLLVTRHLVIVLGAAALMAGTIVGFVLVKTVGIPGFHLFFSGLAWTVLIVEAAGVAMLLLTAALLRQRR